MRKQKVLLQVLVFMVFLFAFVLQANAQEFRYQVRRDKLLGHAEGELIISAERVEYRAKKEKEGRVWAYKEIKLFEILSPTRVRVLTYEDGSRWKLQKDREFTFDIVGAELTQEVSDFLRARISRPFVTSFTGEGGETLAQIPVKHLQRFGGDQGVLKVYRDRLVYEAKDRSNSRSWRWTDIRSVGRTDTFRFEVLTYEPQLGGPDRSFNFSLKEPMTDETYDLIWNLVFRPKPLIKVEEKSRKM